MVLKYIAFVIFSLGLVYGQEEGDLLKNYNRKVSKEINNLSLSSAPEYDRLDMDLHNLELYRIMEEGSCQGYLLLKEVRACSLNGCTANNKPQGDIGYEYYDVSIILDKNHVIQKIKVLNYFSDYGYEISAKRYLKKYQGASICDFSADYSKVDGISGATISYNALITTLGEFCGLLEG